ncbi:hypothetical protein GGI23_006266, partial [Coemansia sp. RSA 2559]
FAFIDFNNSNEATLARGKLHNTKIRGYALEVHFDNRIPQQFYALLDDRHDDNGGESPGYSPPRPRNNEGQDDRASGNRPGKYASEYSERAPAGPAYQDYDAVDDGMDRRDDGASGGYSVPYKHARRPSPADYSDDRRPMRPPPQGGSRKHQHQFPPKRAAYHPYASHQGRERRQHPRSRAAYSPPPPPPPMLPPSHSSPRNQDDEYYRRPQRDEYDDDDRSSAYSDAERSPYSREISPSCDRNYHGSPRNEDERIHATSRNPDRPVSNGSVSSGKSGADPEFNED